jgi:hypothetical protein
LTILTSDIAEKGELGQNRRDGCRRNREKGEGNREKRMDTECAKGGSDEISCDNRYEIIIRMPLELPRGKNIAGIL